MEISGSIPASKHTESWTKTEPTRLARKTALHFRIQCI